MPFWQSILFSHILPPLFDALLITIVVYAILTIFRVKNPATRYAFLFLPLTKPFFVLIDSAANVERMVPKPPKGIAIQLVLRIPDPFDLIIAPFKEGTPITYNPSALSITILLILASITVLLTIRWLQLFLIRNKFEKEASIDKNKYPRLYEILDSLVEEFKVKKPRVVFANDIKYVCQRRSNFPQFLRLKIPQLLLILAIRLNPPPG